MKVVLVVDDTPANIDIIKGILSGLYKLKIATGGKKALKVAQKFPNPDLILLDVMMPEMDGYETCAQLKEDDKTANIPVIFVTANINDNVREKGDSLGVVDYVSKPVNPEKLIESIQSVLGE